MPKNYGLGRGLASLIPQAKKQNREPAVDYDLDLDNISVKRNPAGGESIVEIEIEKISANPHQPRLKFDEDKLKSLSDSIARHGVIQPLAVTEKDGRYELIAGERRLRASQMAGLKKVPVIIRKAGEQEKLELAIIENIQRHDLDVIEEAKGYKKLIEEFDITQEEAATRVGVGRSVVANRIRLLGLPIEIQRAICEGKITEGHAKVILAVSNPEKQRALFEMILRNQLTVRQLESQAREFTRKPLKARSNSDDPETKEIENKLVSILGTKVKVQKSSRGGKIVIEYYSSEDLDNLILKMSAV